MNNIEDLICGLPDPESARRFLVQFAEKHPSHERKLQKSDALLSDVLTLVAYSPLLAATMLQHPNYIGWLQRKRGESVLRNKDEMLESLARFSLTSSQMEPHVLLSRFRRRELLRIYLRDIRRLATIAEVTEEISNLADAILEHALRLARQELDNRYGQPQEMDDRGRQRPAKICIVSLGKLGSRELNYSSDIDLLFIYSDEGTTSGVGARDPITNHEYFIKLAETITKLVGQQTGEGAAYRVDLRLRPHGRVGPLAMSIKDTIGYYRTDAAAWERQVLIRSRSSAGSDAIFKIFSASVAGSVFSAKITVENALRNVSESKQKIDLENINAKAVNVKLGRGGIREIEFIAQALQLAYGGRDKWLRSPHTLISLSRLADRKLLTEHELSGLSDAYAFLRHLEHILQMENGLQTHAVPNAAAQRTTVAKRMGHNRLEDFDSLLETHTANVHRVFERIFDGSANDDFKNVVGNHTTIEPDGSGERHLHSGKTSDNIPEPLRRFPRLAGVDGLDRQVLSSLDLTPAEFPSRDYQQILNEAVAPNNDLGGRLASLRKKWHQLFVEIIAFDALGKLSIKQSKTLQTALAEASIATALAISKHEIEQRYSVKPEVIHIAVLGLGKLGGAGVDYDSDLDLVMVSGDESSFEMASKTVEIFVNALSAMTRDGSLYRVDLRLRPHGKDGALAISRSSFTDYMRNTAAIWEMLAFVKLRGVGGDLELAKTAESEIRETIFEKAGMISADELAEETHRIRIGLELKRIGLRRKHKIDIKYGSGGMLDIYFAIRFLQLRDGVRDDADDRSTGRTLALLRDAGSLADVHFQRLKHGYDFLSALDHYLRLTIGRTTLLPLSNSASLSLVAERMNLASSDKLLENLTAHLLDIRHAFDFILGQNRER